MNNTELDENENENENKYKKVLNINDLLLSNIGYIVGAGVFVLIGKTLSIAGNTSWISVILSGLFIYFISKSYIKVHNKYLSNDADYLAIKDKYGYIISNISIIITLIANIAITYVVAYGFGSYTNSITNNKISSFVSSILGLAIAVIINIYGIESTANINNIVTVGGILGLLLLIVLGGMYLFKHWKTTKLHFKILNINDINILNILYGAFIFIFAYFGFDLIIRLNAESKNNETDIPKALNYSIWISIILYTLIILVMIGVYGNNYNNNDNNIGKNLYNPLSILIKKLTNNNIIIKYIDLCGVALTWNTVLLSITHGSRLLTEFANTLDTQQNTLTQYTDTYSQDTDTYSKNIYNNIIMFFKKINSNTQTPIHSIIFIGVCVLFLILIKLNIISSTIIANASVLLIMILVYLSS